MSLTQGTCLFLMGIVGMLLSIAGWIAASFYWKRSQKRLQRKWAEFYKAED